MLAANEWGVNIVLTILTLCLFFLYFNIFFPKRTRSFGVLLGVISLVFWQMFIPRILHMLPVVWNIGVTIAFTLLVVCSIFTGKLWLKIFFSVIFDAIWMLSETLVGGLLIIYNKSIIEMQSLGSFISKLIFLGLIIGLRKMFVVGKVRGLPFKNIILIMFIPIGSIYIMNAVFMLAYKSNNKLAGVYSLISAAVLLFMNVLIFYIYIKLAYDLQMRRMNMVYEQQLDLCERHQEEIELSILQIRDVRHNMKNDFLSILAYAQKGECKKIIKYIGELMKDRKLQSDPIINTGNIVIDSLVGYWKRTAENRQIDFQMELSLPMEIPFRGADISLILGNLLENAVEGAEKAECYKYIRLNIKYDKNNLLIIVENSFVGVLLKGKNGELKTTKTDAINHGIGLASVQRVAKKYKGNVFIDTEKTKKFLVRVVLYGE